MVGIGVGASNGELMKGGEALEKASGIHLVVFDKMGTLTEGNPCATDFIVLPENSFDKNYLLWCLASLKCNSEHPLVMAVVTHSEHALDSNNVAACSFVHNTNLSSSDGMWCLWYD
jgi:Cu+-exporting ATPase